MLTRAPLGLAPASIGEVIRRQRIGAAYQPMIDLQDGRVIGYEALARGPEGSPIELPAALFAKAAAAGVELEVEWECQRAALEGALQGGLAQGQALFLNIEPRLLAAARPHWLSRLLGKVLDRGPIFAELSERALIDSPLEVLAAAEQLRDLGLGIALDDAGGDERSPALISLLSPDLIKLDLRLVRAQPSARIARIVHAVNAEAERGGTLVLAEAIESDADLRDALALGAHYGQGWLFGHPGELDGGMQVPARAIPRPRLATTPVPATPFSALVPARQTRVAEKRTVLALSSQIEQIAATIGAPAVILSTFQRASHFHGGASARYAELAEHAALVGVFARGLSERPAAGVCGASFAQVDPLRLEWNVIVIAPHFASALVARDLGDECEELSRRFEFAITYERDLALDAARPLIARL